MIVPSSVRDRLEAHAAAVGMELGALEEIVLGPDAESLLDG
jgi:hypothetical protein